MANDRFRARCRDCKRVAQASAATRWCDCGGELVRLTYTHKRRKGAVGRSTGRPVGGDPPSTNT